MTWTDDPVVATATSKNDERLYEWWDKLVGRTLTAAQRALLTELPAGIPRSGCRDGGEASLKCYAPYKYAGDVYVLYFTKYPDVEAMNAAIRRGPGRQRTRARPRGTGQLRDGLQLRDVLGTRARS